MKNCVALKEIHDNLLKVLEYKTLDPTTEKHTRIKVEKVDPNDILDALKEASSSTLTDKILNRSKTIRNKVNNVLKVTGANQKAVNSLIEKLSEDSSGLNGEAKAFRRHSIALETVIETISGEIHKANNMDVEITEISDNGIPAIPTHRLAASIGRKILRTEGYRIGKQEDINASSAQVEELYYVVGMAALETLSDTGAINIHESGTDTERATIKDFLNTRNSPVDYKHKTTKDVDAVSVNPEFFGVKNTKFNSKDPIMKYFRNELEDTRNENPGFHAQMRALRLVNYLSVPSNAQLPLLRGETIDEDILNELDDYALSKSMLESRKALQENSVHFSKGMHGLFKALYEATKDNDDSASYVIRNSIADSTFLQSLFGIENVNMVASNAASFVGRNRSKTMPIDDLVEYFEAFDGDSPVNFEMPMRAGTNSRLYYHNTVANPHTSKLMRHALAVKEYSLNRDSEAFDFFVNKVAQAFGAKEADMETIVSEVIGEVPGKFDEAIEHLNRFNEASSAGDKLRRLTFLAKDFPGMDAAELVTGIQAVIDIRNAMESGKLTTEYAVSSDATASGGLLTFMQAAGSGGNNIKDALKALGILKGEQGIPKDVYSFLQDKLKAFEKDGVNALDQAMSDDIGSTGLQNMVKLLREHLFNGDMRNLSKTPTMTLIYGQSRGASIDSMSKDFSDLLVEKLNRGKEKDARALLSVLFPNLPNNFDMEKVVSQEKFMEDLQKAFKDSRLPEFLHRVLTDSVSEKYLSEHKKTSKDIFNLISSHLEKFDGMKVMPAAYVMDNPDGDYSTSEYNTFGVTLSKKVEVINETDNGNKVLTREDQLRQTIMDVSLIHGIDTSLLYRSINGLAEAFDNTGTVVVHDDVRSRADFVMETEKRYVKEAYDVAMNYDIHEQVLKAMAVKYPAIKSKSEYTNLLKRVELAKKAKQDLFGDKDNGFDFETDSIIGDGFTVRGIGQRASSAATTKKSKGRKKAGESVTADFKKEASEVLRSLSPKSKIIEAFLNSSNPAKVQKGSEPSFNPASDTINVSNVDTRGDKPVKVRNPEKAVELIEHEIVHSYTTGYIEQWFQNKVKSPELDYTLKAIGHISKRMAEGKLTLSKKNAQRMEYVLSNPNPKHQLAEFISIMSTEPGFAKAIYKEFGTSNKYNGKNALQLMLEKIKNKVLDILLRPTEADVKADVPVDAELLYSSVNFAIQEGKSLRETQADLNAELQEQFDATLFAGPGGAYLGGPTRGTDIPVENGWISFINASVARRVNDPVIRKSGQLLSSLDDFLRVNYPTYRRVLQRGKKIYGNSEGLQSLVHKITNDNINNVKKNKILSMFAEVKGDNQDLISRELARFKAVTKNMNETQLKAFHDFSMKMSMADYFMQAEGVTDIEAELAATVDQLGLTPAQLAKLDSIVEFNLNGTINKDTKYNVKQAGFGNNNLARKYVALKSIKELGIDRFNDMQSNSELMQVLKDVTLANAALISQNKNLQDMVVRDNGIIEQFEEPVAFRTFGQSERGIFEDPKKTEWVVLREATDRSPGIAYRKVIDSTYQEGAFTTVQLNDADIRVPSHYSNSDGVVEASDGVYKVVLTPEEKQKLGALKDPSQAIVRTMAHNMAIQDSNDIRNALLEQDTHYDILKDGQDDLVSIIKDKNHDNPWLLNAADDQEFDKLHPAIKANYMRLPVSLSNVGGFNKQIKYVRKDIAYWLVGSSEPSIVRSKELQWAIRVTKNLVSGTKIGMVILNPMKIAMDNVSNISYLAVMGVDPMFIQSEYRKILIEFNDYKKTRNELNMLRLRAYSDKEGKYAKRISELESKLKDHPGNGFVERGFINSLGSELVMQADDPSSGFKHDIDFVLKKIFTEKGERNNKLAEFIMKASKYGPGVEEVLETFSILPSKAAPGKELEEALNDMAERIKDIKNEDDIVTYMHQYINSPDSQFVKLGTHMTDLADVTAKETYYRYLVKNGIDPKKAEIEVIDSFPDYKEGMPTKVKQLSDVGILMFPSYWIRIQKAIYRMVKNKPISFGTELAIQDILSINSHNIFDQNIVTKANSFFGLVHTPWDHIGVGSVLPTHVL